MRGTHDNSGALLIVLAFDYGEKRIGVAIGNTITHSTRPLSTLRHKTVDERFTKIQTLLSEWEPEQLVVGIPSHPDGTAHEMTQRCTRFAQQLQGRFGKPVALVDERYTSAIAQQEGAQDIDAQAAALILDSYFQSLPS
jgi:putative holliday junction resolvase